jgi:ComF family protein
VTGHRGTGHCGVPPWLLALTIRSSLWHELLECFFSKPTGSHRGTRIAGISVHAPLTSYRDSEVWQTGVQLFECCYGLTADLTCNERFNLRHQCRRAVFQFLRSSSRSVSDPGDVPQPPTPNPQCRLCDGLNALLALLLAPQCAACHFPLSTPLGGPVCEPCWSAIRPITPPICESCGDPLPSWRVASCSAQRCARCRRTVRVIARGRAIGEYDGSLRQVIHALKYEGRHSIARRLGLLMRERGCDLLDGVEWVVPVPLHPRRERERGFNQAAELARHLGLPVCSALRRLRHTVPQVELPAPRRHANVRGAFDLTAGRRRPFAPTSPSPDLTNACVLLVDDVSTTGATLEECARVLKEAGVREVRALTAARVVRRRSSTPLQ